MTSLLAHDLESKERTEDIRVEESVTFATMLLPKLILEGLTANGFKKPSPIQLAAIPHARCGLDLIVQAKSGTGKTLVFTVTALESIDLSVKRVQVIVIAPTREIAHQITDVIHSVGKYMKGLRVGTLVGGRPLPMDKAVIRGCHIAVGCPGRLRHLIEQKYLDSEAVRMIVLDEADKLFDEEFAYRKDINYIFNMSGESKQVLALSATYPPELVEFTGRFMRRGQVVTPAGGPAPVLLGLRQFIIITEDHPDYNARLTFKQKELFKILNSITFNLCCIFHHYSSRAESMNNVLRKKGFSSFCLTGKMSMDARMETMAAVRSGECRILVSTDLAARGLDSPDINLVVNMGLPWHAASYLHRMGRAGRFGSQGVCISLISEGVELKKFQKLLGQIGGTSMCVHVVPGVRKYDIWNEDLDNFDKIFGTMPSEDDENDDSEETNNLAMDELKIDNNDNVGSASEKSSGEAQAPLKPTRKNNNFMSFKELQSQLTSFVDNEKAAEKKKILKKERKMQQKKFPLSYSQMVRGRDATVITSSSSEESLNMAKPPTPRKPVNSSTNSAFFSVSDTMKLSEISEARRNKRKHSSASCTSVETESGSYAIVQDSMSDDTMYTVDEADSRSGIDLNVEHEGFESISEITSEECSSNASQMSCPHCQPLSRPLLLDGSLGTDWYQVFVNEINNYVSFSRRFRVA